jgi:hypothetical protein
LGNSLTPEPFQKMMQHLSIYFFFLSKSEVMLHHWSVDFFVFDKKHVLFVYNMGCHGHQLMVDGFTTTYAISAYHH